MNNKETTSRLFDMDNICRTCLKVGEMNSIYDKIKYSEEDLTIALLLREFGVMQISEDDSLPQQICIKCTKEINKCYFFIKKCQLSDEILHAYVKENEKDVIQVSTKEDVEVKNEIDTDEELSFIEQLSPLNIDSKTDKNEELYDSFDSLENKSDDNNKETKLELIEDEKSALLDSENVTEYKKTKHKNESSPPYECKICGIIFKTHEKLLDHNKTRKHRQNHYNRKVPCETCRKPIRWSYMTKHKRTHTHEKPHTCQLCGASFGTGGNLRRHILARHTQERPYKCKFCQRGFTQLVTLRFHMHTHTGERPYICNYCGKGFAQPFGLKKHLIVHARKDSEDVDIQLKDKEDADTELTQIYYCDTCDSKFSKQHLLNAHRAVHLERKFLCSDCGKRFTTLVHLQSHSTIHTGARPYQCSICGKSFAHSGTLISHKLIHTGRKPYVCKICNRPFTQQNHLKYHMRTHSGERPYACSICGKTFALNGNLTVHMRTHTGETPYSCPTCGKGFYDSSSMKKHHRGCQ